VPSHNAGLLIRPTSSLNNNSDDHNSMPVLPASPPTIPSDSVILSTPSPVDDSPLQSSNRTQFSPPVSPPDHMPSTDDDDLTDLAASMADLRSSSDSSPPPDIDSLQECTGVLVEWTAGLCVGHLPVSSTWYSKPSLGTHRFRRK
jgi:hypothetical protein